MSVQGSVLFCWSWTKVSVLGSQVLEQALMESYEQCEVVNLKLGYFA